MTIKQYYILKKCSNWIKQVDLCNDYKRDFNLKSRSAANVVILGLKYFLEINQENPRQFRLKLNDKGRKEVEKFEAIFRMINDVKVNNRNTIIQKTRVLNSVKNLDSKLVRRNDAKFS